jgi:hypothetical protein
MLTVRRRPRDAWSIRLAATIALLALAGVACTSPGSASPTAAPSASKPKPTTSSASTSTASPASTPTALPAEGPLVRVRFEGHTISPVELWTAAVNRDGRFVWEAVSDDGSSRLERQLSPSGIELVTEAIEGEPALDRDGQYPLVPIEGTDAGGHGRAWWYFTAWPAGREVQVSVESLQGLDAYYREAPEGERLSTLATLLSDPEAWLPTDAWAGAARTWEPDDYLVRIVLEPSDNPTGPSLADLGLPFDVRTVGEGDASSRCAVLTGDQLPGLAGPDGAYLQLAWPEARLIVTMTVTPRLEGDPGCSE